MLAGVTWLAGDLAGVLVYAHRGPLVHAMLTFPTGRTRSKPLILVIALAYVDGLVPSVARAPWTTIVLMAVVVVAGGWRWAVGGAERRARGVAAACAAAAATPLVLASSGHLAGSGTDVAATWMYEAAIVLTAGLLTVALMSGRSVRAATTGLVVHLAGRQEPRALRDALSRTVGDPALEIAYRVDQEWVDEAGQPVQLPAGEQTGDRVVTLVEDGGTPVAALVHDPAALRDNTLARSVSAALRLVVANVRLQAEDAAHIRELAASRRRLVEAGDEQRRGLRDQLRGGAEQLLAEVSSELMAIATHRQGPMAGDLDQLVGELDAACVDLTRFAQGVHPEALTEHGLSEALRDLADHAAVPVAVQVPSRRFPAPQEAAAYFVCSEALANVAKYAGATGASINVEAAGRRLLVRVADDGRGGADPTRGSGLRGLKDRVEALGGRFSIWSPVGAGTRMEAELPIPADAS
jgi:signal transduction histidine kinase